MIGMRFDDIGPGRGNGKSDLPPDVAELDASLGELEGNLLYAALTLTILAGRIGRVRTAIRSLKGPTP